MGLVDMESIEIALASNEAYFCGLLVTACSIAEYADKSSHLSFHILDGGLTPRSCSSLQKKVLELHADSSFDLIPFNEADFSDCPSWNGSRLIYSRLMLPKWLPDVDWVVYSDVDFLWMRDIAELWRQRDEDYAFVGVLDPDRPTRESDESWCAAQGLVCPANEYCCAGLSFVNLRMFREAGLFDRVMELNRLHPPYNDQTLFNIVAHGKKKILGEEWQCFTQRMTQARLDSGIVIHYAGEIPWKRNKGGTGIQYLSDTMLLWHQFHARYLAISVWTSLCKCFSPSWIVFHRLATLIVRCPVVKILLKSICYGMHHPGVWVNIEYRVRKLVYSEVRT